MLDLNYGVINRIKTICLLESRLAVCYRRELVREYCNMTNISSVEAARDIAYILESDMVSKSQANRLKSIFFGKLCSNWCIIASLPQAVLGAGDIASPPQMAWE